MQADLPHTLLRNNGKGKGGSGSGARINPNDPAFDKQAEALRRAKERREAKARGEAPFTMSEIFK